MPRSSSLLGSFPFKYTSLPMLYFSVLHQLSSQPLEQSCLTQRLSITCHMGECILCMVLVFSVTSRQYGATVFCHLQNKLITDRQQMQLKCIYWKARCCTLKSESTFKERRVTFCCFGQHKCVQHIKKHL